MTLVGLAIICSREYIKQNSKYDLVRWGIPYNSIYGFVSENLLILRLPICFNVTKRIVLMGLKTIVMLNMRSRQFTKSYLSGDLNKIPVRTCLNLDRKISIKILSVLVQKLCFRLHEIKFLTKQATPPPSPPPPRDRSDLTRSYPSILSSISSYISKLCCQV